jgi:hypothetical protein
MALTRNALIAALLAQDHLHPDDELVYTDDAQTALNYVRRLPAGTAYPGRLVIGSDTFVPDE